MQQDLQRVILRDFPMEKLRKTLYLYSVWEAVVLTTEERATVPKSAVCILQNMCGWRLDGNVCRLGCAGRAVLLANGYWTLAMEIPSIRAE